MKKTSSNRIEDMENKKIEAFLSPLENIKTVEAPDFLFTRIREAIVNRPVDYISLGKAAVIGAAFCALILFNFIILSKSSLSTHQKGDLSESFQVLPYNDFYK